MQSAASTPDTKPDRFPPQIKYIIGNEACERFSYYGMLSILTVYLSKQMGRGDDNAREIVHLFATAVYFLPLFGAWLADRWLGRYWTILSISLFYCLGHGTLAAVGDTLPGVYAGLALIAIGAGGIKPCVSAFVGDQFVAAQERALTKVYGLFYWSINFGAMFGFALIPTVRKAHIDWTIGSHVWTFGGYSWAFGIPGFFMALATLVFWLGRKRYVRQPPARVSGDAGIMPVILYALKNSARRRPGQRWLDVAKEKFGTEAVEDIRSVARIIGVFLLVPVFFALYNQVNSTWVLQGERMTPFTIFGFKVDGETMQSAGSLLVMIWVPILTQIIYPLCEKMGLRPTPLRRMATGMVLAGVTYIISALLQQRIDQGESLSIAWQLVPYIVLVAGEVLVSATGLEFAFADGPKSMRSLMMSFWLMTIAGGHFLIAFFTYLKGCLEQSLPGKGWAVDLKGWLLAPDGVHISPVAELYFYAGLMFVVSIAFMFVVKAYQRRAHSAAPARV